MNPTATIERPTVFAPSPPRQPTAAGIWVGLVAVVLALAAIVTVAGVSYATYRDRIRSLSRTPAPGTLVVRAPAGADRFLYLEGAEGISLPELAVRVTDPNGHRVSVVAYRLDLHYDAPSHPSRVGRALATFLASTTGSYRVSVVGKVPPGATVAVGENVAGDVAPALAAIAVLLVVAIVGLVVAIATGARRSRARSGP